MKTEMMHLSFSAYVTPPEFSNYQVLSFHDNIVIWIDSIIISLPCQQGIIREPWSHDLAWNAIFEDDAHFKYDQTLLRNKGWLYRANVYKALLEKLSLYQAYRVSSGIGE